MDTDSLRIRPDEHVKLDDHPTRIEPVYKSKDEYKKMLKAHTKQLSKLQERLYAADTYSLLLIFQAMDTAGKDGAIRHVMSGINPQGCQVYSFKHPSPTELDHDFLWRTNYALPERGRIGIFNRSYYEEVLVVRVHPDILDAENLPPKMRQEDDIWARRYESILDNEKHLYRNGTRILKFFLHLSKDEQRRRFMERIDDPKKNWKFSEADIQERQYWDDYMKAYEQCLGATSSEHAPWYAIPADDKKNARLLISKIVLDTLEDLDVQYPKLSDDRLKGLETAKERLLAEDQS